MILSRAGRVETVPVDSQLQSASFQEYCSRRLYHLNRRKGELKDFALGFAEASHELLMKSGAQADSQGRPARLRQYSSIYVRVISGDEGAQLDRLRELMDAGVFVLEGGPDAPRTKTRDSNPITQFVLTYRKLFGLSNFIGLSQRDRFELSGRDLEEWLSHPDRTREILLRNLTGSAAASTNQDDPEASEPIENDALREPPDDGGGSRPKKVAAPPSKSKVRPAPRPQTLFEVPEHEHNVPIVIPDLARARMPRLSELVAEELTSLDVEVLILGRGFEERALASVRGLGKSISPSHALLVSYPLDGYGPEVEIATRQITPDVAMVNYREAVLTGLELSKGGGPPNDNEVHIVLIIRNVGDAQPRERRPEVGVG